jgi:tRNA(fMet)-specific endonuclease VapC
MLQYLLDTDHLTLFQRGHTTLRQRLALQPAGAVGIGVVTVEESLRGRLARLARASDGPTRLGSYRLLVEALLDFAKFPIVPYGQPAEDRFQQLHTIRIGTQDRKIGAIALANQLVMVARNRRDFSRIPGLTLEDWSV